MDDQFDKQILFYAGSFFLANLDAERVDADSATTYIPTKSEVMAAFQAFGIPLTDGA